MGEGGGCGGVGGMRRGHERCCGGEEDEGGVVGDGEGGWPWVKQESATAVT